MPEDLGAVATGTAVAEGTPAAPDTPEPPAVEIPEGGPVETETPEGEPGAEEEPPLPEEEPEGGEEPADPGSAEAKIRADISALKKTNPTAAKAWAKDHYEKLAYQKEFPSVHDARNAKATIESLGGEEGIGKMQEELTDWRGEAEAFANGDRGLIEQLHQENPEALVTAGQNVLDVLMESSEKLYDQATIPHMHARLESAEVPQMLEVIANHIKEGDGQQAWDNIQKLRTWFSRLKTMAQQMNEGRNQRGKADPEREAIARERQELDQAKAKQQFDNIGSNVNRLNNQATARLVEPFFRELKLTTEGRKHFIDQLNSNIFRAIKKDGAFKRNESALRKKGDVERSAQFIHAKFRELLPIHFRSLRNALYPNYKPRTGAAPAKPNGAAPTNGKPATGSAIGNGSTIPREEARRIGVDLRSADAMTAWIAGRNVLLKNGKTVNLTPGT